MQRLSFLLLMAVALITTSCGTVAQASGTSSTNSLKFYGSLPPANIQQVYNAKVAVVNGNLRYSFSLKSGSLPPGVTLDPATGTLFGMPSTVGKFSFEVLATDSPLPDQNTQQFIVVVADDSQSVKVAVTPTSANIFSNGTEQFTASVSGTSNTAVTWSATSGSVNRNGLYTAPTVTSPTNVTVTAVSNADPSKSATAAVTIDPQNVQALQITNGSLPQGQQGELYNADFTATGGTTPYTWSVSAGTLPAGVALNTNGELSGTPTSLGTFNFTAKVTDADNRTATGNFSLTVASNSGYDGPAQLPIATVDSALADTPAPGSVIPVKSGGDLQSALNNAECGDTITLQAGATFTGTFLFPAKSCDSNHWIIVRTSSPDSALPAEGQRLTPCYAGVASLPGRPQYPCSNPQNVLAKLIVAESVGPVLFQNGANHYRLLGLEITRPTGTKGAAVLMSVQSTGSASYIVVDRSWLHGTAADETLDGFALAGTNYVAVVDSYLNDFHCTAITGSCTDSHAVSGGVGDHQDGPYKIYDNFLEAAGESVFFGGGAATTTPTDITVQYNHFFKPWQWMTGNVPFQGGIGGNPFIVKNHLELKNAIRVLAENNLMEDCWGGFSQTGFGILLGPKNQHTPSGNDVCPICAVTDVTVRYTHIAHGGGGIVMATSLSGNGHDGKPAKEGTRWSIHDVVMDDMNSKYLGLGALFIVANGWPSNALNTITINHVTGFPDTHAGVMILGDQTTNPAMYGFVFTNNLVATGNYPVWNIGGGNTSCSFSGVPVTSLNTCFTSYTFNYNALLSAPPRYGQGSYPAGNMFGPNPNNVVVQYNNGNGGNYELQSGSPYKNAGSDGKDLGADIVGLNEALAGVE